jgi:PAS domain S-box-containing protein
MTRRQPTDESATPATLSRLALAGANRLRQQSPTLACVPKLVLARRLRLLVEAALEGATAAEPRPVEERLAAIDPDPEPAHRRLPDLVLEVFEAERLLEEVIVAEGGPEALLGERWSALRGELQLLARHAAEQLDGGDEGSRTRERRVEALLDALPEAILLVDADDRVRYANTRVREAYGLDPATAAGRSLADVLTLPQLLLRLEDRDAFLETTLALLADRSETLEDVFRDGDGSTFLRRCVPAGEGGEFGRAVITTNVTRLRERNRAASAPPGGDAALPRGYELARPRLRVVLGGRA